MKPHPYLRAYMAGALIPTILVMFIACVYALLRFGMHMPFAIERGLVFPLAFVPNIWGAWNVLYVRVHQRHAWKIGVHGAILPCVLAPLGFLVASLLSMLAVRGQSVVYFESVSIPYTGIALGLVCAMALYYVVWKYVVSFLNDAVGVA